MRATFTTQQRGENVMIKQWTAPADVRIAFGWWRDGWWGRSKHGLHQIGHVHRPALFWFHINANLLEQTKR